MNESEVMELLRDEYVRYINNESTPTRYFELAIKVLKLLTNDKGCTDD